MRALLGALVLTACTSTTANEPHIDPIPFKLDSNGVQLLDRALRIDFGRTDHSTIPAMSKLVGAKPAAQRSCADGVNLVEWPDGTALLFVRGEFRGWSTSTSRSGVSCSSNV